jgi:hypothetical protein
MEAATTNQGRAKVRRHVVGVTKVFTMASKICGSSVSSDGIRLVSSHEP